MARRLEKIETTLKGIIAVKCIECVCGDLELVVSCSDRCCPLWDVRPKSQPKSAKGKFWSANDNELKAVPVLKKARNKNEEEKKTGGGQGRTQSRSADHEARG